MKNTTTQTRLEKAGFVFTAGWLPASVAKTVLTEIERHRAEAEAIASTPKPRGRPVKNASRPMA